MAAQLDRVRVATAETGRRVRFGIRLHVITRDTAAQAWADARRMLTEQVQSGLRRSVPEGQQRMLALPRPGAAPGRRPGHASVPFTDPIPTVQ